MCGSMVVKVEWVMRALPANCKLNCSLPPSALVAVTRNRYSPPLETGRVSDAGKARAVSPRIKEPAGRALHAPVGRVFGGAGIAPRIDFVGPPRQTAPDAPSPAAALY